MTQTNILDLAGEADARWFRDELAHAWRTAQDEAIAAYEAWRAAPGRAAYAVYTAAQGRATKRRTSWLGWWCEARTSMSSRLVVLAVALCGAFAPPHAAAAATNDIFTVAGTGEAGFSGDGGLATAAQLSTPAGLAPAPDAELHVPARNERWRPGFRRKTRSEALTRGFERSTLVRYVSFRYKGAWKNPAAPGS